MPTEPTVFVVDDDTDLCDSLRWLIESEGLRVETYASARGFLDAYNDDRPGVLVLDVRMPGMSGLELQEHLLAEGYGIPIIILTGHGDVPMAVRAVKRGALEFLQKPVNDEILLDSIRTALRLDAHNRSRKKHKDEILARLARLTPRERQVMELVIAGKPNKQIAHELSVSEKTVEVHRKRLMKKAQVTSAVELVRVALSARDPQEGRTPDV
jgi:two-component system response regulator FixJ